MRLTPFIPFVLLGLRELLVRPPLPARPRNRDFPFFLAQSAKPAAVFFHGSSVALDHKAPFPQLQIFSKDAELTLLSPRPLAFFDFPRALSPSPRASPRERPPSGVSVRV